jgi:transcriptional repressor NrdR
MWCPRCANEKTTVECTVKSSNNERFRKCPKCGYVWQTIEVCKHDGYIKRYVKSLFEDDNK